MSVESNLAAFNAACFSLETKPKLYEDYGGQEIRITTTLRRGKFCAPSWTTEPKKGYISDRLTTEINNVFKALNNFSGTKFKPSDIARKPYMPYEGKILYDRAADTPHTALVQYALVLNPSMLIRPHKASLFLSDFFKTTTEEFAVTLYVAKSPDTKGTQDVVLSKRI